ncbi:MAG: 30S ribosomal protein S27e [Nanoarchaeota archaeon]
MINTFGGKFLEVVCSRCKNTQTIYGKCSSRVKCDKCNKLLVDNTGGRARIRAFVKEVFS